MTSRSVIFAFIEQFTWTFFPCDDKLSVRKIRQFNALFAWRGDTLYDKNARGAVRASMPDDQRYAPNADTTYYASERFAAFSLLPNTLRHFCDSNHGRKTTLIVSINTLARVQGSALVWDQVIQVRQAGEKCQIPPD